MTNQTEGELMSPVLISLGVYLIIAAVVGGLANGMALYVFFTNKILRSPTNTFIIGLLVCDLCMCVICIPLPAASNIAQNWMFNWSGCVFHAFTVYFFGLSNMYILTAISVDRFIIIAKPLYAAKINYRVVSLALFTCYFFGFLWSSMPLFGWSSFAYEGAGTSCVISYDYHDMSAFSYNVAISINCFFIPVIVMVVCYCYIFSTVRQMNKKTVLGKSKAKKNMAVEKKLAKTIAIMIGVYLFSWTPYAIMAFWVAFGFGDLPVIVATIPAMFAKSASVWNPLIYVYTNIQFRKAFAKQILCLKLRLRIFRAALEKDASKDSRCSEVSVTVSKEKTYRLQSRDNTGVRVGPATVDALSRKSDVSPIMETNLNQISKVYTNSGKPGLIVVSQICATQRDTTNELDLITEAPVCKQ